jgi:hypothetical protein
MARQEKLEIATGADLASAKAKLLSNAQEVNIKTYMSQHPWMVLTGTFFAGFVLGGSVGAQAQLTQMTVQALKQEVLRQLIKK